ncbi:MAG: DUF192 domain-containing protein [Aquimonas sp.]|nr:DUF192 domain-containing protein [Aquimonas sp.]
MTRSSVLLSLLLALAVSACRAQPEHWVELRGHRFHVELAADEPARQLGLMHRESLAKDQGMLFVFPRQEPLAFWMKNTLIPLDILYFDADRRLVSVAREVPPCRSVSCPVYPSRGAAQYVLELNSGRAREIGAQVGDELVFSAGVPIVGAP